MKPKLKIHILDLILNLHAEDKLTGPVFFVRARAERWGKSPSSDELVDGYNYCLGILVGTGRLTIEEARKAMEVPA